MTAPRVVATRGELLQLLCEAAELEHGIACSYLYAGFSLKRELSEGGMSWEQQQQVRRWAGQIYFVASQEMLHLALVWNLTTAIGGTPYYGRPNFPQDRRYYPLNLPIVLEPFGLRSLRRFIAYEHPQDGAPSRALGELLRSGAGDGNEDFAFGSIGELYRLIQSGFETIDAKDLFIGAPTKQMTPEVVHFPDLVRVTDRDTAVQAIHTITHQGEGTRTDRIDSHFGAFVAMFKELLAASKDGKRFSPARPAITNPSARLERGYGAVANPLEDPVAKPVAALFDSVYSLMLRMLAWAFEFDGATSEPYLRSFCACAIELMPRVLLPLGEGLMRMPAGESYPGLTAGPGFGLSRLVMLPPEPRTANTLCRERFAELAGLAADLARPDNLPDEVRSAFAHLGDLSASFAHRVPAPT
jgi:hypothetical protein